MSLYVSAGGGDDIASIRFGSDSDAADCASVADIFAVHIRCTGTVGRSRLTRASPHAILVAGVAALVGVTLGSC